MATDKKSFLLYCDLIHTVERMPVEKAGELFIHILKYVNDKDPKTDDLIINLVFEPIKQQFKRDLKKWDNIREKRSLAGQMSAEARKQNQHMLTHVEQDQQTSTNSTVNVNDNVTVNVNVNDNVNDNVTVIKKEYKNILLSKVTTFDYPEIKNDYLEIAKGFQELFRSNLIEAKASTTSIDKAKGAWVDEVRLMIEVDKVSVEEMRELFRFLKTDPFWKQNILSVKKLREKYPQLKLKLNGKQQNSNSGTKTGTGSRLVSDDHKRSIVDRILNS